jgi:hypothetical protein
VILLTDKAYRPDKYVAGVEQRCSHQLGGSSRFSRRKSDQRKRSPNPVFDANVHEVLAAASRIASMADREIRERFHHLVDKSIENQLTALERFEMERIELRLDAEDRDPDVEANDREWEFQRIKLLESIEDLLSRLKR